MARSTEKPTGPALVDALDNQRLSTGKAVRERMQQLTPEQKKAASGRWDKATKPKA